MTSAEPFPSTIKYAAEEWEKWEKKSVDDEEEEEKTMVHEELI